MEEKIKNNKELMDKEEDVKALKSKISALKLEEKE